MYLEHNVIINMIFVFNIFFYLHAWVFLHSSLDPRTRIQIMYFTFIQLHVLQLHTPYLPSSSFPFPNYLFRKKCTFIISLYLLTLQTLPIDPRHLHLPPPPPLPSRISLFNVLNRYDRSLLSRAWGPLPPEPICNTPLFIVVVEFNQYDYEYSLLQNMHGLKCEIAKILRKSWKIC